MSRDGAVIADSNIGGDVRVGHSGLAFTVGQSGVPSGSPAAHRHEDIADAVLTAEQLSEKLSAAEARRETVLNDVRQRCCDHNNKVHKACEQKTLAEKRQVEETMGKLKLELEKAEANQDEHRQALLEKLKHQEQRHAEIRNHQIVDFEERLRQLDSKYTDTEGNRHHVLAEMVEKLKEHNERVQKVHDAVISHRGAADDGGTATPSNSPHAEWELAKNEREDYMHKALARLNQEKLLLHGDELD